MNNELLDSINYPEDIKELDTGQLRLLCSELRDYMLECCSVNPGHLASSLGAVELIVALHYVYDTPEDKLVFDVGHQAYAHKILTGRKELFRKNRMKDGISGFPNIFESEYDAFGTGHSSTSISAALGLAKAFALSGKKNKVVTLIGDGSMTGGLAYEGLNNAGACDADLLVILNDNNQSIDKNTGAFHEYLLKITTDPVYNNFKETVWEKVGKGRFRDFMQRMTKNTKSSLVRKSGGSLFEALGFRYFGPIDGNNIEQVVMTLKRLKSLKGPRILHVLTKKGKGYMPAEADPSVWHAPGKFDPETGKRLLCSNNIARYQDVFGEVLSDLARKDERIVGVTPAMSTGCGMNIFAKEFPDRFFDVGIEEEHAVTFSAGLVLGGMKPYCNIYSSFSQRAYDQIIHDVALQNLPVVLCFDRGGLVGEDGATHTGAFDLAAYRSIPNAIICAPSNELELKNAMFTALDTKTGPFIIRYPRGNGEGVDWKNVEYGKIPVGKSKNVITGEKIAILALGPQVNRAKEAAEIIYKEKSVMPGVYNMLYLKPIDEDILDDAAKKYDTIITVEDGTIKGGLYGAVTEYMAAKNYKTRIVGLGIPDKFISQGSQNEQRSECLIDTEGIYKTILKFLR